MEKYSFTLVSLENGNEFQLSFAGSDLLDAIKNLRENYKKEEIISIIKLR